MLNKYLWVVALFSMLVLSFAAPAAHGTAPHDALPDAWLRQGLALQQQRGCETALVLFQQALAYDREHRPEQAPHDQHHIGDCYRDLQRYQEAVRAYEKALQLKRSIFGEKHREVAATLNSLAGVYVDLGEYAEAKARYELALAMYERNDGSQHPEVATVLANLAEVHLKFGEIAEAKARYERALVIAEAFHGPTHPRVAEILDGLGILYRILDDYGQAMKLHQRALAINEKVQDSEHASVASSLNNLAATLVARGEYGEAKARYERALAILERLYSPEHPRVAATLTSLAFVYKVQGAYGDAKALYERALAIWEKIHGPQHPHFSSTLNGLAGVYYRMGKYAQALTRYERVLAGYEETHGPDHVLVATALNNLGQVSKKQGDYWEAKARFERALAIKAEVHGSDHRSVATTRNNLGQVYQALGDYEQAKAHFEPVLATYESIHGPEHHLVATALNNLAQVHHALREHREAKVRYERALTIKEKVHGPAHPSVATTINGLAAVYDSLGQHAEAKAHYERALAIYEEFYGPGHPRVAATLSGLGNLYVALGEFGEARSRYQHALAIAVQAVEPALLWRVQGSLSELLARQKQPSAAIFFGKQAVNALQSQRRRISALEELLQASFLKANQAYYKDLADLLIAQGRLPEAQQVLAMLKEQEYFDFIRRDAAAPDVRATAAGYNDVEQESLEAYETAGKSLAALGAEMDELKSIKPFRRSPEQKARIGELEIQLDAAYARFSASLDDILATFAELSSERQVELAKHQLDLDLRGLVRRLGPGVVLLHYLVMDDGLHILVTTSRVLIARRVDFYTQDLNLAVYLARENLQHPNKDPRPITQSLYRHLIAPVAQDLADAGAKTLMLSLDGTLRYLPFAALHDGERYLAERYDLALFTAAARDRIVTPNQTDWYLAGLGLSKKLQDFSPLPFVPGELHAIVREDDEDPVGVLEGSIHLDDAFTLSALREGLEYPVVHLASHFVFRPGTEKDSFLLLGDGTRLDLAAFRAGNYDLGEVDLLTLSACETALGGIAASGQQTGKARGLEIEGFAVMAQKKGAKGVLATLWPVADASTGRFMQLLYRLHEEQDLTKAGALRQAQLAFIRGEAEAEPNEPEDRRGAVLRREALAGPDAGYSHPYYWAPFILLGNWL